MRPRTALVFPGQGSQRNGMLAACPENDSFDRLLDAAEALSGLDLRAIEAGDDPVALANTRVAQPLLYLADWVWGSAFLDGGLVPDAVAGHSLGELAALAIAGVFSVEAGLELVIERSRLMADAASAHPGTMAAVLGLETATIASVLADIDGVWLANDNSPGQVVVSGTCAGVDAASLALSKAGARRIVPLNVSGAFHSPLMESARAAYESVLQRASFGDAAIPVIQNVSAMPACDAGIIRDQLIAQITAPVRWTETLSNLVAEGPVLMVEAGPGSVLSGLAKRFEGILAVSAEANGIQAILEEVS